MILLLPTDTYQDIRTLSNPRMAMGRRLSLWFGFLYSRCYSQYFGISFALRFRSCVYDSWSFLTVISSWDDVSWAFMKQELVNFSFLCNSHQILWLIYWDRSLLIWFQKVQLLHFSTTCNSGNRIPLIFSFSSFSSRAFNEIKTNFTCAIVISPTSLIWNKALHNRVRLLTYVVLH